MGEIKIRDIDDFILLKIDKLAKRAGLSRSQFCKKILETVAEEEAVRATEEKYSALIKQCLDQFGIQADLLTAILNSLNSLQRREK